MSKDARFWEFYKNRGALNELLGAERSVKKCSIVKPWKSSKKSLKAIPKGAKIELPISKFLLKGLEEMEMDVNHKTFN
jgi:hypothetical protein